MLFFCIDLVSSAHQGSIYLMQNTVKNVKYITAVYYVKL